MPTSTACLGRVERPETNGPVAQLPYHRRTLSTLPQVMGGRSFRGAAAGRQIPSLRNSIGQPISPRANLGPSAGLHPSNLPGSPSRGSSAVPTLIRVSMSLGLSTSPGCNLTTPTSSPGYRHRGGTASICQRCRAVSFHSHRAHFATAKNKDFENGAPALVAWQLAASRQGIESITFIRFRF
jgi:hypothetical protein